MANYDAQQFTDSLRFPAEGIVQSHDAAGLTFTNSVGVAEVVKYLMRGRLAGVDVYWYATFIDSAGSEYPGGPSGLSSIRLVKRRQ